MTNMRFIGKPGTVNYISLSSTHIDSNMPDVINFLK